MMATIPLLDKKLLCYSNNSIASVVVSVSRGGGYGRGVQDEDQLPTTNGVGEDLSKHLAHESRIISSLHTQDQDETEAGRDPVAYTEPNSNLHTLRS